MHVLVAEQVSLVSEIMAAALRDEADMRNVVAVDSGQGVLDKLASQHFDVALIHCNVTDGGSISLLRAIRALYPEVKIIVLGIQPVDAVIMRYLQLGVAGYLDNDITFEQLLATIRAATRNETLLDSKIAALLIERLATLSEQLADHHSHKETFYSLTPREQEVLALVAKELSNREIAEQLTVQVGTVKNHVHRILKKLGAADRYEAQSFFELLQSHNATDHKVADQSAANHNAGSAAQPDYQEQSRITLEFLPLAGPQDGKAADAYS